MGVGYSRNRCIDNAKGEFICFFDDDDINDVLSLDELDVDPDVGVLSQDENGDFTVNWPDCGFFPEESKIILG